MEALSEKEFKAICEFFYEAGKSHKHKEDEISKMLDEGTKQLPEAPSFENAYFVFTSAQPTTKKIK